MKSPDGWKYDQDGNSLKFYGFDLLVRLTGSERTTKFTVYFSEEHKSLGLQSQNGRWNDESPISPNERKLIKAAIERILEEQKLSIKVNFGAA